jgi:hypothetical protein
MQGRGARERRPRTAQSQKRAAMKEHREPLGRPRGPLDVDEHRWIGNATTRVFRSLRCAHDASSRDDAGSGGDVSSNQCVRDGRARIESELRGVLTSTDEDTHCGSENGSRGTEIGSRRSEISSARKSIVPTGGEVRSEGDTNAGAGVDNVCRAETVDRGVSQNASTDLRIVCARPTITRDHPSVRQRRPPIVSSDHGDNPARVHKHSMNRRFIARAPNNHPCN